MTTHLSATEISKLVVAKKDLKKHENNSSTIKLIAGGI